MLRRTVFKRFIMFADTLPKRSKSITLWPLLPALRGVISINVRLLWFIRVSMIQATRVRILLYWRWLNREILSASSSPGPDPRPTLLRASRFVQILNCRVNHLKWQYWFPNSMLGDKTEYNSPKFTKLLIMIN